MSDTIAGIHHVTAIAGDAQRNVNFYAGTLGLRLVKRTVNFDDPFTYHFYYGDGQGAPGTILTFFPWQNVKRGRQGTGQATAAAFRINESSVGYWLDRFVSHNVEFQKPVRRFGESVILFRDHDGLMLELVAAGDADAEGWGGTVPAEHALGAFHNVTLCVEALEHTERLLIGVMGFRKVAEEGSRTRFATGDGGAASLVDVHCAPDFWQGVVAGGTIHHVAWRADTDAAQLRWRAHIAESGVNVTPVLDRQYFRSIYFREPGGTLFEIATDPPGFATDEPAERLGEELKLPAWLEPNRAAIEARLPPLNVPRDRGQSRDAVSTNEQGEEERV